MPHDKARRISFIKGIGHWTENKSLTIDGCIILQCTSGNADILINSRHHILSSGHIAVLTFDIVAVPLKISSDFSLRAILMNFDLAQDLFFSVTSNRLWDFLYATPVFDPASEFRIIYDRWFDFVDILHSSSLDNIRESVVSKELENFFLITDENICRYQAPSSPELSKNRGWALAIEFYGLLNRYYSTHHDVAYYAGLLNITPNYLNIISRRYSGVTAKEQINMLITLVVKNMLETTSLSIKDIATRLNYEDSSYLCRVFRKRTGMSPMEYRNKSNTDSDT